MGEPARTMPWHKNGLPMLMIELFPHAAGQPMAGLKSHGITSRFYQGMEIVAMAMAIITLSSTVYGATYYVDFSGGADSNNGTSKATPWKHQPYMQGWTGSYSHSAGDRFIFKGGVTWDKTCLPMDIAVGGGVGAQDYYGLDKTWYTGGSWTRPIFDAQNTALGGVNANHMVKIQSGYLTFDNFELTGFYWDVNSGGWVTSLISLWDTHILIANCLLHNWSHDTLANGADDALNVVITYDGYGVGQVVSNCVIVGNGDSGVAVRGSFELVTGCSISNVPNAILFSGTNVTISHNEIGPMMGLSFAAGHPNAIEQLGNPGLCWIHDNYIHDTHPSDTSIEVIFLGGIGNGIGWVYNNVCWNLGRPPIEVDTRSGNYELHAYNNTLVSPSNLAGIVLVPHPPNLCTLYATNNHAINNNAVFSSSDVVNAGFNLLQGPAQAAADGFSAASRYAPTKAKAATVDAGVPTPYPTDILGVSRPQGAAWDIGAYELQRGGGTSMSVVPAGLNFGSVTVGTNSDQTLTVQNTGSATFSGSATVAAPFSIISGGSYTLSPSQNQVVTVRFAPTVSGTNSQSQTLNLSGGSVTTVVVSGSGFPAPPRNCRVVAVGP
jgi:hypothetical protein